jgi:hypothetical protein
VEVNSISFVPIIPVATSSSCWEGMLYLDVTISNDKLSSINEEEMLHARLSVLSVFHILLSIEQWKMLNFCYCVHVFAPGL